MKETYKQADAQFLGKPGTRRKKGPKFISHFILFAILMFSIVILVWAHYAIIDEFIVGEGKVIPSRQVQMIANLEGGIVEQILVKEGMVVEKGQPLLIIDDTRYVASYKENLVKETSLEIKYLRLKAEAEKKEYSIPEKLKEADPGGAAFEMSLFKSRQEEYKELQERKKKLQEHDDESK